LAQLRRRPSAAAYSTERHLELPSSEAAGALGQLGGAGLLAAVQVWSEGGASLRAPLSSFFAGGVGGCAFAGSRWLWAWLWGAAPAPGLAPALTGQSEQRERLG
jgi:hypothetical protein